MPLTTETKSGVAFHVRESPQLISPVLRGFFSGYSVFPPSLKSTQIRTIEGHKFISNHNTVTCYLQKIRLLIISIYKALTIAQAIEISTTKIKDLTEQDKSVRAMYKNKREKKQTRTDNLVMKKTRVSTCRHGGRNKPWAVGQNYFVSWHPCGEHLVMVHLKDI